ncbi:MAG: WavE lipopolysaccharide synthesis family protein [Methylococcaceae bacterium]
MMFWIYSKNLVKLAVAYTRGRSFWNYRLYKKYQDHQNNHGALKLASTGRFAIVMQGPLIVDSNFTVETLKLYRHNFPDAILIFSTWFVPDDIVKLLEKYAVHIIQNAMPENHGISNVNLQIVTSRAGVLAARDLEAQQVLKTRTDQRIYHPSLETYLFNLVKTFPLAEGLPIQINRLVGISLGTFKYRLYGVTDMFLYGHIDDMLRYWNIPLDTRRDTTEERKNAGHTLRQFSMWRVCEVYFCTEFLKSIGRDIAYTLADSFQVLKNHFVIIDQAAIKLYWHKYTLNEERYAGFGFFDPELSFNDWLVLYHSLETITIDENILDQTVSICN